jgi:hypothetical protein
VHTSKLTSELATENKVLGFAQRLGFGGLGDRELGRVEGSELGGGSCLSLDAVKTRGLA